MKSLFALSLMSIILAMGVGSAYAEIVSIETDKPQYFIGDEIKITVIVDENDTHETDITFRIMTSDGNNIINIGRAGHIEGNLYEGIISKIKDSDALESGEHILWTTRIQDDDGERDEDIKQPIVLVKESSPDPNRPKLTNQLEADPIFGTACLAEGDVLDDKGQCVKKIPSIEISLNSNEEIQLIPLSQYEELQQENLELTLENRELKNRVSQLTNEIVRMTDEFIVTITNQMNWFISQNSN